MAKRWIAKLEFAVDDDDGGLRTEGPVRATPAELFQMSLGLVLTSIRQLEDMAADGANCTPALPLLRRMHEAVRGDVRVQFQQIDGKPVG